MQVLWKKIVRPEIDHLKYTYGTFHRNHYYDPIFAKNSFVFNTVCNIIVF